MKEIELWEARSVHPWFPLPWIRQCGPRKERETCYLLPAPLTIDGLNQEKLFVDPPLRCFQVPEFSIVLNSKFERHVLVPFEHFLQPFGTIQFRQHKNEREIKILVVTNV